MKQRVTKPADKKVLTQKVFIDTIKELREVFASKKDFEGLATREDLERFATREDLERFATREDLKNELKAYATRKDLEDVRNSILDALDATDEDTKKNKSVLVNHEKRITTLETAKN